jgi:hypothetical protein
LIQANCSALNGGLSRALSTPGFEEIGWTPIHLRLRLEENRAILIAYEIDRGPKNPYGIIPGVLGRSEYGQEFCVAIAHPVYLTGLSFGKVCQVFDLPPMEGAADDRRLLLNEMGRLLLAEQLFTFVTAPPAAQPNGETHPVAGTNNESERTLRNPAEARDTGRTNKTSAGTRWRTIVTSVLESLRLYLPKFTLATVIAEVRRWEQAGKSCFEKLLTKLKIPLPEESILDSLYPPPSG